MRMHDVLSQHAEPCPGWLQAVNPGGPLPLREFLAERTVFYPGSYLDGHPIKVFGSARAAHCFVYADYWLERERVVAAIEGELPGAGLRGYRPVTRFDLKRADFEVRWNPAQSQFAPRTAPWSYKSAVKPYALLQVWERVPDMGPQWGADRLALLMLGADAHAVYEGLFCQPGGASHLYAMLLQDHGFGGNYAPFGGGGLTERIAEHQGVRPKWQLVCDANTRAWQGFEKMVGVEPSHGSNRDRFLYRRSDCAGQA